MAGVQRINSIGLRNFMMFLKGWNKGKYRFTNCSMEFIDQINLIPSILKVGGKGWVDSCETLVVCKGCGRETDLMVKMPARPDKSLPVVTQTCAICGGTLEPAVEGYFHFLQFLP